MNYDSETIAAYERGDGDAVGELLASRADWQSANDYEAHCEWLRAERWRDESAHVEAWRQSAPYQVRPFRFEDLNGRPEPASWGPCYPKTASASVEKWRAIARVRELTAGETALYGQAVHAWIRALNNPAAKRRAIPESDLHYCYSSAKRRGQIKAAFTAAAAADRRQWCEGEAKGFAVGERNLTIAQVYARAMAEKRARLELAA